MVSVTYGMLQWSGKLFVLCFGNYNGLVKDCSILLLWASCEVFIVNIFKKIDHDNSMALCNNLTRSSASPCRSLRRFRRPSSSPTAWLSNIRCHKRSLRHCSMALSTMFLIFSLYRTHDDVIQWKHFPRYWPFVRGSHRSPVNSLHKGQWRGALMFSLIYAWITVEQTIVRLVLWDPIVPIMTSL